MVLGPHGTGQAIVDAIGHLDRFGLVVGNAGRRDRAEDLVLNHLVVLLHVHHDGGLEVVTPVTLRRATSGNVRVRRFALEESLDLLELRDVVQRRHQRVLIGRTVRERGRGSPLPVSASAATKSSWMPACASTRSPPCSPDQR